MTSKSKLQKYTPRIMEFFLHKYPLINALTLLMLFAERAPSENTFKMTFGIPERLPEMTTPEYPDFGHPPLHPRLVYANLIGFLACGLLMSSYIKRKESALVFCGQLIYFAYNFYSNPKLHYREWLRIQMSTRHIGCVGVYLMFAFIVGRKKSVLLGRSAEVVLGLYLFSSTYIINNVPEVRSAVLSHIIGGDWGRYLVTVVIAACALSFFSGYFLRDMSICAAVAVAITTLTVDCDFVFWSKKGVHFWNQARMLADNVCICVGFVYFFFHLDNKLKKE